MTIGGPNAVKRFCPNTVLLHKFHLTDGWNMRDQITRGRRSKRSWSNCVLCIPFILSGSPNKCWPHTCDTCVITTLRLGLRAPLVARKKPVNGQCLAKMTICQDEIFGLQVILTGQVPCKWNGMILFKLYVLSTLFVQEELYFRLLAIMSKAPGLNDYCIIFKNPCILFCSQT